MQCADVPPAYVIDESNPDDLFGVFGTDAAEAHAAGNPGAIALQSLHSCARPHAPLGHVIHHMPHLPRL